MIDPDLIGEGITVREALRDLGNSGVIEHQIAREREKILTGDAAESLEEVAKQVLAVRAKIQNLQALAILCTQAEEELNDAYDD